MRVSETIQTNDNLIHARIYFMVQDPSGYMPRSMA